MKEWIETRVAKLQTNQTNKEMILEGIPVVFDEPAIINDTLGSYNEIITAEAITPELLEDVTLLYNHDPNRVPLARSQKTMKLTKDHYGIKMVANLDDTQKDIYMAVKRGDLNGMSFSFIVAPHGDEYIEATNTRIIHKIKKIYEVSIVPFPAYDKTHVKARSMTQGKQEVEELKIKINQILKKEF